MALPPLTVVVPERGWRINRGHALIAACLCWLAFAMIAWAVQTGRTDAFDAAGLLIWRNHADLAPHGPPALIEAVRDFTALGGQLLRNLFAIAAIGVLAGLSLRREAVLFGSTILTGWLVDSLLKGLFARARPTIVPHLMEAGGYSFPSGHSFNSAVVYIAMALAFAAMSPHRSVRWTIVAIAMLTSALIALSRVWLGVHYPTDALAGWLGGAGWAFLAAAVLYRPARTLADSA